MCGCGVVLVPPPLYAGRLYDCAVSLPYHCMRGGTPLAVIAFVYGTATTPTTDTVTANYFFFIVIRTVAQ